MYQRNIIKIPVKCLLVWSLLVLFCVAYFFRLIFIYIINLTSLPWKSKDRILMEPPTCLSHHNHRYVTINKVRLHYVQSGDSSQPLMLFICGFPDFWFSWRQQISEFSKHYWVVALDLRGQNQSDKPNGTENYKLETIISDLKAFIECLGRKKCTLICHDWGAFIGWRFVAQYRHMIHKYVMLNNPPLEIYNELTFSTMDQFKKSWCAFLYRIPFLAEKFLFAADFDAIFNMWNRQFTDNFTVDDLETYKYVFSKPGTLTAGLNYYRANLSFIDYDSNKYEIDGSNGMFILGQRDKLISQAACILLTNRFPKLRVEIIPNANHFMHQVAPKATNEMIRHFLNE